MKKWIGGLLLSGLVPGLAQAEWVNGEVVKVDAARKRVMLRHEAIKVAKMEPMTMPFRVDDATILTPFHEGDRVRFDVVVRDDELYVLKMEPRK